jgi:hypothetical protein
MAQPITQNVWQPFIKVLVDYHLLPADQVLQVNHHSRQSPQIKANNFGQRIDQLFIDLSKKQADLALVGIDETGRWAGIEPYDDEILDSSQAFVYSKKTRHYSVTPHFVLHKVKQVVAILSGGNKRWVDTYLTTSIALDRRDIPVVDLRRHPQATVIIDSQARTFPKQNIQYKDMVTGQTVITEVYLSANSSADPKKKAKQVMVFALHGFGTRAWKSILAIINAITHRLGQEYIIVDVPRRTELAENSQWSALGLSNEEIYMWQTALHIQAVIEHFTQQGHPAMMMTHSIANEFFRYIVGHLTTKLTFPDGTQRQLLKFMDENIGRIPVMNVNPFFARYSFRAAGGAYQILAQMAFPFWSYEPWRFMFTNMPKSWEQHIDQWITGSMYPLVNGAAVAVPLISKLPHVGPLLENFVAYRIRQMEDVPTEFREDIIDEFRKMPSGILLPELWAVIATVADEKWEEIILRNIREKNIRILVLASRNDFIARFGSEVLDGYRKVGVLIKDVTQDAEPTVMAHKSFFTDPLGMLKSMDEFYNASVASSAVENMHDKSVSAASSLNYINVTKQDQRIRFVKDRKESASKERSPALVLLQHRITTASGDKFLQNAIVDDIAQLNKLMSRSAVVWKVMIFALRFLDDYNKFWKVKKLAGVLQQASLQEKKSADLFGHQVIIDRQSKILNQYGVAVGLAAIVSFAGVFGGSAAMVVGGILIITGVTVAALLSDYFVRKSLKADQKIPVLVSSGKNVKSEDSVSFSAVIGVSKEEKKSSSSVVEQARELAQRVLNEQDFQTASRLAKRLSSWGSKKSLLAAGWLLYVSPSEYEGLVSDDHRQQIAFLKKILRDHEQLMHFRFIPSFESDGTLVGERTLGRGMGMILARSETVQGFLLTVAVKEEILLNWIGEDSAEKTRVLNELDFVYAAVAEYLGLYRIASEIRDVVVHVRYPQQYDEARQYLEDHLGMPLERADRYLHQQRLKILRQLGRNEIVVIKSRDRVKMAGALLMKALRRNVGLEIIDDPFGFMLVLKDFESIMAAYHVFKGIKGCLAMREENSFDAHQIHVNGYEGYQLKMTDRKGRAYDVLMMDEENYKLYVASKRGHWKFAATKIPALKQQNFVEIPNFVPGANFVENYARARRGLQKTFIWVINQKELDMTHGGEHVLLGFSNRQLTYPTTVAADWRINRFDERYPGAYELAVYLCRAPVPVADFKPLVSGQALFIPMAGTYNLDLVRIKQTDKNLRTQLMAGIFFWNDKTKKEQAILGRDKMNQEFGIVDRPQDRKFLERLSVEYGLSFQEDFKELHWALALNLFEVSDIHAIAVKLGRRILAKEWQLDHISEIDNIEWQIKLEAILGVYRKEPLEDTEHVLEKLALGQISAETLKEWFSQGRLAARWDEQDVRVLHVYVQHDRPGILLAITNVIQKFNGNILELLDSGEKTVAIQVVLDQALSENDRKEIVRLIGKIPDIKMENEGRWYNWVFERLRRVNYRVSVDNKSGKVYRVLRALWILDPHINIRSAKVKNISQGLAKLELLIQPSANTDSRQIQQALNAAARDISNDVSSSSSASSALVNAFDNPAWVMRPAIAETWQSFSIKRVDIIAAGGGGDVFGAIKIALELQEIFAQAQRKIKIRIFTSNLKRGDENPAGGPSVISQLQDKFGQPLKPLAGSSHFYPVPYYAQVPIHDVAGDAINEYKALIALSDGKIIDFVLEQGIDLIMADAGQSGWTLSQDYLAWQRDNLDQIVVLGLDFGADILARFPLDYSGKKSEATIRSPNTDAVFLDMFVELEKDIRLQGKVLLGIAALNGDGELQTTLLKYLKSYYSRKEIISVFDPIRFMKNNSGLVKRVTPGLVSILEQIHSETSGNYFMRLLAIAGNLDSVVSHVMNNYYEKILGWHDVFIRKDRAFGFARNELMDANLMTKILPGGISGQWIRHHSRLEVLPWAYPLVIFLRPSIVQNNIVAPEMKKSELDWWHKDRYLRGEGYVTEMTDPNNVQDRAKINGALLIRSLQDQFSQYPLAQRRQEMMRQFAKIDRAYKLFPDVEQELLKASSALVVSQKQVLRFAGISRDVDFSNIELAVGVGLLRYVLGKDGYVFFVRQSESKNGRILRLIFRLTEINPYVGRFGKELVEEDENFMNATISSGERQASLGLGHALDIEIAPFYRSLKGLGSVFLSLMIEELHAQAIKNVRVYGPTIPAFYRNLGFSWVIGGNQAMNLNILDEKQKWYPWQIQSVATKKEWIVLKAIDDGRFKVLAHPLLENAAVVQDSRKAVQRGAASSALTQFIPREHEKISETDSVAVAAARIVLYVRRTLQYAKPQTRERYVHSLDVLAGINSLLVEDSLIVPQGRGFTLEQSVVVYQMVDLLKDRLDKDFVWSHAQDLLRKESEHLQSSESVDNESVISAKLIAQIIGDHFGQAAVEDFINNTQAIINEVYVPVTSVISEPIENIVAVIWELAQVNNILASEIYQQMNLWVSNRYDQAKELARLYRSDTAVVNAVISALGPVVAPRQINMLELFWMENLNPLSDQVRLNRVPGVQLNVNRVESNSDWKDYWAAQVPALNVVFVGDLNRGEHSLLEIGYRILVQNSRGAIVLALPNTQVVEKEHLVKAFAQENKLSMREVEFPTQRFYIFSVYKRGPALVASSSVGQEESDLMGLSRLDLREALIRQRYSQGLAKRAIPIYTGQVFDASRLINHPKFYPNGIVKPFMGLTVILRMPQQIKQKLERFQQVMADYMRDSQNQSTFSWLPADSFHMTLVDIDPSDQFAQCSSLGVSSEQLILRTQQMRTAFENLPLMDSIRGQVKGIGLRGAFTALVHFKDIEDLRKILIVERMIQNQVHSYKRDFLSMAGHVSFAYVVQAPRYYERFLQILHQQQTIDFGQFEMSMLEFTYFPNMGEYQTILTYDLTTGEILEKSISASSAVVGDAVGRSSLIDPLTLVMTMRELARKEKLKKQYWDRRALVVRSAEYLRTSREPRRYLAINRLGNVETVRVGAGQNFVQNQRGARLVDISRFLTRSRYRETRSFRQKEVSFSSRALILYGVNMGKQFVLDANMIMGENIFPVVSNRRAEFPVDSVGRKAGFVRLALENVFALGMFSQGQGNGPMAAFRITYFKIQYLIYLLIRVWRLNPFNGLAARLREWLVLYYANRQRVVLNIFGNKQKSPERDYSEHQVRISVEMNLVKVTKE